MKNPIIGITLDFENSCGYSKFPWYAIRENYLSCLYKSSYKCLINVYILLAFK